jgi:hypothetical protein
LQDCWLEKQDALTVAGQSLEIAARLHGSFPVVWLHLSLAFHFPGHIMTAAVINLIV